MVQRLSPRRRRLLPRRPRAHGRRARSSATTRTIGAGSGFGSRCAAGSGNDRRRGRRGVSGDRDQEPPCSTQWADEVESRRTAHPAPINGQSVGCAVAGWASLDKT